MPKQEQVILETADAESNGLLQLNDCGGAEMASDTPSTRLDRVGDVATWGAHIALFYETKDDLLDTVVPYCRTGLERNESCLWFVAEPYLTVAEAWQALRDVVDGVDRYQADGRIEIDSANDWFAGRGAAFDGDQVAAAWYEKLASVSSRGQAGLRITGDAGWVDRKNWEALIKWEDRMQPTADREISLRS